MHCAFSVYAYTILGVVWWQDHCGDRIIVVTGSLWWQDSAVGGFFVTDIIHDVSAGCRSGLAVTWDLLAWNSCSCLCLPWPDYIWSMLPAAVVLCPKRLCHRKLDGRVSHFVFWLALHVQLGYVFGWYYLCTLHFWHLEHLELYVVQLFWPSVENWS